MTYREYLTRCDFKEIWPFIKSIFKEKGETEPLYERLYNTIKELPASNGGEAIVMSQYNDGDWELTNILDPHSELIDRKVDIKPAYRRRRPKDKVIAAHLLFWSSMYGFVTSAQYQESFDEWLDDIGQGPFYEMNPDNFKCNRYMCKWIYFVPSMVLFDAEEINRWRDVDNGEKEMTASMIRVMTESGVAELSKRTHAEIMVFLPEEWEAKYPELENVISNLPLKTRITKWMYKTEVVNDMINRCNHAKYVPYVILAEGDSFDERRKEYLYHPKADGGFDREEIENAVSSLNRFDNYTYTDFYPDRVAKKEEALRIGRITEESLRNKRHRYWSRAIQNDYAYDWISNLLILKKKLEYNIGYWKYVRRYVGWDEDARRMQTACRLIDIVDHEGSDSPDYVNDQNAESYGINIKKYGNEESMIQYQRGELYLAKAYRLLWRLFDHNMRDWWD